MVAIWVVLLGIAGAAVAAKGVQAARSANACSACSPQGQGLGYVGAPGGGGTAFSQSLYCPAQVRW
jgi:hypothetical protein